MPYASRDGLRLHYAEGGDRAGAAVLLHTGGCGDGSMWERAGYTAPLDGYRLLLMDHRGRGRSDRPRDLPAHRLEEYVADVVAVLDDAGIARAALVGYSDGGRVAIAVAARHPDRVSAVVVLDGVGPPQEDDSDRTSLAQIVRSRGTRAVIEEMAALEPEPPPPWLVDTLAETDPEMFALSLDAWAVSATVWADLPAVTAPTLLLSGGHGDPEAGADLALARDTLPAGSATLLPDLAHLQMFWRTDRVLPHLAAFLESQASVRDP